MEIFLGIMCIAFFVFVTFYIMDSVRRTKEQINTIKIMTDDLERRINELNK
jgi:hypothetical protein